MTFTLPNLPYAHDALAPHMSKETWNFITTSIIRPT